MYRKYGMPELQEQYFGDVLQIGLDDAKQA